MSINKLPIIRSIYRHWQWISFQRNWRNSNRHNRTSAATKFPTDVVKVGKHTYGELHIYSYFPEVESLTIGNYVSIGPQVKFILGGNHKTDTLTTFPLRSVLLGEHCADDAASKGPIAVQDEVWIGAGSTILSGVTIGKGCIVAAGSVVTKDLPPYTIAAGNPARPIRQRFAPDIVEKLMQFNLSNVDQQTLRKNLHVLYQTVNSAGDVERIINQLTNNAL